MTDAEKLTMVKTLLEDGGEMPSDEKLTAYLSIAKSEILAWIYHLVGGVPEDVMEVPSKQNPPSSFYPCTPPHPTSLEIFVLSFSL